tara:strand:+ start:1419 stop:1559 length:141 start_codon:yes stop_codon:yes gene_type:complete
VVEVVAGGEREAPQSYTYYLTITSIKVDYTIYPFTAKVARKGRASE